MNKQRLALAVILIFLGFIGVASTLTMDLPLPPEMEALLRDQFSDGQIKLLLLINPSVLLILAVFLGAFFHHRVGLRVPLVEKAVGLDQGDLDFMDLLKYGVLGGVVAGVLLSLTGLVFHPILPAEFIELGESLQPSVAARLLYGGITEELLMRFGLMSFIAWLLSMILGGVKPSVFWISILVSALVFAAGHFPVAYQAVGDPSLGLLTYILIGNSIGGIAFGWLYWKKGLESAMIAHMLAHVVMLLAEPLMG